MVAAWCRCVSKEPSHKYEALRDFGADQFLTKPVDARLLVDVLRRHLS
jgi:DNA-binding response OmpR family regulator